MIRGMGLVVHEVHRDLTDAMPPPDAPLSLWEAAWATYASEHAELLAHCDRVFLAGW
jgi:hypothetical protein